MTREPLRLMLLSIPVAGLIGLVVLLLRGADFIEPALSNPGLYLVHQYLLGFAYVLPFPGFLALYLRCRGTDQGNTLPLLGLLGLLWGTALALPALGNASFILPAAVDLGSVSIVKAVVVESLMGPGLPMGIVAAVCYTLGPILLGIALWKTNHYPRAAVVLFAVHGALLSFGFSYFPLLIVGWVTVLLSGALFVKTDVQR